MNNIFERFRKGLAKTRELLGANLVQLFQNLKPGAALRELREPLEEILIKSDLGARTSLMLIENLERRLKGEADLEKVKAELREEILAILKPMEKPIQIPDGPKPFVIMVVGVNGTGKTTSIGKLALRFKNQGLRVMLAAADTFRAASVEQLQIWAKRANAEIVSHASGANPSAVCFDAISSAKSKGIDVVIIDTAGRLHTRASLMDELKKIKRVSEKALERKIDETLLVLDATTGQNAIEQAKIFHQELVVSGIILTKLDGTAKGGIIIPIADQFRIPIRLIGVGEEIEDLADFEAQEFVKALL